MLATLYRPFCLLIFFCIVCTANAGVDKQVKTAYISKYVNRTFFLKIPILGTGQIIRVGQLNPQLDRSNLGQAVSFKVGEQVRILDLNFRDRVVRFRIASLDQSREAAVQFQFLRPLQTTFEQRKVFDEALDYALTEGTSFREIEDAKVTYVQNQFDHIIRQLAGMTGTGTNFIVDIISQQNPEYRKVNAQAVQAQERLKILEGQLTEISKDLEVERFSSSKLRAQSEHTAREIENLKGEVVMLVDERGDAHARANQLKTDNERIKKNQREYERQINELILNLSSERDQSGKLGTKVENLGDFVATLQSERSDISGKLTEASEQISGLQSQKDTLREELTEERSSNKKLGSRLRALTSDKKSINAQFLKMRDQKEILEIAVALTDAVHLVDSDPDAEEEGVQIKEVFLVSQKIGRLRIDVPQQVDQLSSVEFVLESPDTITFSDQERALYSALVGDKIGIEANWDSPDLLGVVLAKGEAERAVSTREKTRWEWGFNGELKREMAAALKLDFLDRNSQQIPLYSQQFVLHPAGLGNQISRALSISSLLLGLIAGFAGALVWVNKRRVRPEIAAPVTYPVEYVPKKKL
jgi:peptidoglycan hydrolase CwlO-like protein